MNLLIAGIIGLASGVASGLFGVGGGIVMVPAMILLMKLDMKIAVATSLVVIIPVSLAGSIVNQSFGRIDWRVAIALIPMAIIGGIASTWFKEQVASDNLKHAFGGFLILVGFRLLLFK